MARGIMDDPPDPLPKTCANLRVALFSGNYNYVRDGANQALNRLVGHLQRQGAQVRVYAPKVANPAFASMGKLVGVPSIPIPGRNEYRFPVALSHGCGATWPSSRQMSSTSRRPTGSATARSAGHGGGGCR